MKRFSIMVFIVLIALLPNLNVLAGDGPSDKGTFTATGYDRSSLAETTVAGRKVHHTDARELQLIIFEDGSWALDEDGQFPYVQTGCYPGEICNADSPSTIYEDGSWIDENGNTGCMAGGICNE